MNKKWWIVVVVIALVAALGLAGYQLVSSRRAAAEAPAETAVVRRGMLLVTVSATGSLVPQAEVSLAFTSGGRVAEVLVAEGQVVAAGQALARLDTDDLALQVAQAEANLAQVQAGPRAEDLAAAEAAWRSAQANYDQLKGGSRPEELTMAGADLELAKNSLLQAQAAYDKIAWDPEASSRPQAMALWQATAAYQKAQAAYELKVNGPTAAELAMAQAQVDQARAQLEKLKNSPTPEELAVAQAQADQARLRLKQATLTAPMSGTVTALRVQVGEMVGAGQPAVVLSDLAALEVEVNLDETDVARVAVGQEAQVSLDAFPGVELAGEVTTIAPVAQAQAGVVLYPVTIRLTPADTASPVPVRAGMTADVTIAVASKENALIVPLRAIETEGERATVQRLVGGRTERVAVTLGMMTDTEVEITSGLSEGDVVLVAAGPVPGSTAMGGLGGILGGGQ